MPTKSSPGERERPGAEWANRTWHVSQGVVRQFALEDMQEGGCFFGREVFHWPRGETSPSICWRFLECIDDTFLLHVIEEPTRRGAMLDPVLTKEALWGMCCWLQLL